MTSSPACRRNRNQPNETHPANTPPNKGITEEEALKKGMEEKSKEFVEKGAKVYAKA